MQHSAVIAMIGFLIFFGVGTVVAASSCGMGPAKDDPEANETTKRSDDYSFFGHKVCTALKSQHNR